MVRTDVPGKGLWRSLLAIPYLIPPFIGAIAWTFLLGPVGFSWDTGGSGYPSP